MANYAHLFRDDNIVLSVETGKIYRKGDVIPDGETLLPIVDAEPHYEQYVRSRAGAREDRDFDTTHLSPENSWGIGRDYIAHALRYGWPMNVIREHLQAGARILEMGCGAEIPMFRTLCGDASAVKYYKPSVYCGADLNKVRYKPNTKGCETIILEETNIVTNPEAVPEHAFPFDLIVSFEVIEHMDKVPHGDIFLDQMFRFARQGPAGTRCLLLVSTPVNDGQIARNHIYEWRRNELHMGFARRGGKVLRQFGMYSNLRPLLKALTPAEIEVWNSMADFHSPHMLSCFFSVNHPEVARNIAWLVEVVR